MKINDSVNLNSLINKNKNNSMDKTLTDFQDVLEKAKESGSDEELKKVSQDFESIFINMMFQNMRKSVGKDGILEKSYERELFESMLDEEMSKEMSKGQGIGLAKMLERQLSKKYY